MGRNKGGNLTRRSASILGDTVVGLDGGSGFIMELTDMETNRSLPRR